jgi:1,4-dihydroxy-2-naphthoyl-CoA hydrolase
VNGGPRRAARGPGARPAARSGQRAGAGSGPRCSAGGAGLGFPYGAAGAGLTTPEARVDRDGEARVGEDGATWAGEDGAAREDGASQEGSVARAGGDGAAEILKGFARLSEGTLPSRMGITVTAASPEQVTGTMPVDGNIQPYGLLHGGASCVLAESLGSLGAALQAGPGRFAVGIEISATHHRAVAEGIVTGVATRVHGGRTTATYEIAISDDRGRRVCSARLTCLLRDQIPPGGHDPGHVTAGGR